jgi:formylglycine-generating enzyme required for sulfatase activity
VFIGLKFYAMRLKFLLGMAAIAISLATASPNRAVADDEEGANEALIQAIAMLDEARNAGGGELQLLWLIDTLSVLDTIVSEYPGSSVAVKLWSGQQIGRIKYSQIEQERDEARADVPGHVFADCEGCPKMAVVGGGSFDMGSPVNETGRWKNEGPVHKVTVPAFALGIYEATFEDWAACIEDGGCGGYEPYDEAWGRGLRPVINVSWDQAVAFTDWLSLETNATYRLSTEAEWEYASRAGSSTRFSWGDEVGEAGAVCHDCGTHWDYWKSAKGDELSANDFGLHHMHGNVWEWTQDCWNRNYEGAPTDGSAMLTGDCDIRMIRGGSYSSEVRDIRSAARFFEASDAQSKRIGFRVVRELP